MNSLTAFFTLFALAASLPNQDGSNLGHGISKPNPVVARPRPGAFDDWCGPKCDRTLKESGDFYCACAKEEDMKCPGSCAIGIDPKSPKSQLCACNVFFPLSN